MKALKTATGGLRKLVPFYHSRCRIMKAVTLTGAELREVKPFEEIPGPKGVFNIPYIGAIFHFKPFTDVKMDTTYRLFKSLLDKYGSLVRIRLGQWTVLVEDPADIGVVMKSEGKYPRRMSIPIHRLFSQRNGAFKTLGELDGEEWQKIRSPLNIRMMRAKSAQHYLSIQNEVADELVSRIKVSSSPEDIIEIFYRYACESISVVTYNKRLGYLAPDIDQHPDKLQALKDIQTVLELLNRSLRVPTVLIKHCPLKIKKDYFSTGSRLMSQTQAYYKRTMEEIKQKLRGGTLDIEERNLMLSLLISDKLTPEEMTAVAFGFFIAGTDSTARNLQMFLYNLARHPDKQRKLYEEVFNVIGRNGPLNEQALSSMTYLQACLKESFRVTYPTSGGTQRFLPTDIVLQGYRIPAGTSVLLMNQRTVKNPKYFPDPDFYIPERWLRDETGKRATPIPSSALLPFGFGPRQCLGKRFAEQEIYLAVTKILQNFEVSLEPNHEEIELCYTPFVGSRYPIRLVFRERE